MGWGDGGGEESNVRDFPAPNYIYIIFKSQSPILNLVYFYWATLSVTLPFILDGFIYGQSLVVKLVITEDYNLI